MAELRKRTDQLPDDYWVVLVGDMITEEALPTYMAMLNTLDGVRDETGAAPTPWGRRVALHPPLRAAHAPLLWLKCRQLCSIIHHTSSMGISRKVLHWCGVPQQVLASAVVLGGI